jgi:cell division protein FtsW
MSSVQAVSLTRGRKAIHEQSLLSQIDLPLLLAVIALLSIGLVMVGSASVALADRQSGQPFYYLYRQMVYIGLGVSLAVPMLHLRLDYLEKAGPVLLMIGLALLLLVLVPGVGRTVNGSTRWLPMGVFNFQVSELAKLFVLVYLAGYLVRRNDEIRTNVWGFLKPILVLVPACLLMLLEPDFGAAVVLLSAALGMMYLAGVRFWQFFVLLLLAAVTLYCLAYFSPYRWARVVSFMDPWADPFNSGFQLTQSLIAFGQGEWFGVGIGGSIQKLFYLPEAHTDFLFAVLAEELGMVGTLSVILLFAVVILRAFVIGARAERAEQFFAAYLAYGIGLWFGLQAFINMGVNMGVLPTKGLTLPLMSYGGSSMVMSCVLLGLLLRISLIRPPAVTGATRRRAKS